MLYCYGMTDTAKQEYNRLYRIANRERIAAQRKAQRDTPADNVRRCSVSGCNRTHAARGFCDRHYQAWRYHGEPTVVRETHYYGKTLAERLAFYTRRTSGCWEWTASRNEHGYGTLNVPKGTTSTLAHRIAWELEHGKIPAGLNVLHRCDNRGCVRPDHLFLGTQADNNADMLDKGRNRTKLTEADVRSIRQSAARSADLALKYGVSTALIGKARAGRIWKHVK